MAHAPRATKTQDSSSNTSPNQAHHRANLTHRNAKQKLTIGKRVSRQAHLEVASQSRPSVGIRIPRASLTIARHTRHQSSHRQARPESKIQSSGTTARLRPRSQTQPDQCLPKESGSCPAFVAAHTTPSYRRMHQVKEDQKTSSEPKLRPVELDCGKTHHLQRRESRRGHDATRHVTRSQRQVSGMYAPTARLRGLAAGWRHYMASCAHGLRRKAARSSHHLQSAPSALYLVLSSSPLLSDTHTQISSLSRESISATTLN